MATWFSALPRRHRFERSGEPWGAERAALRLRHPEDLHATAGDRVQKDRADVKLLVGKG